MAKKSLNFYLGLTLLIVGLLHYLPIWFLSSIAFEIIEPLAIGVGVYLLVKG